MAGVFLAREPELKRLVAVKVLAPRHASDPRARQRFEREAQAAASLSHPNIVAIHTVGRLSDGVPYIVMQFVKGKTISERLETEGPLAVDEARTILSQVASALAAAHARGIVHRDVRPGNILYEEETGRALLADFGIARILASGDTEPGARLTATGELVGDPTWMSPEQLTGAPITEQSDIYAFGLLGYALLAKRSPYDADSRQNLVRAQVLDSPRRLSELRPDIDPALEQMLLSCLAKVPAHRPNASEIVRRLASTAPSPPGAAHGSAGEILSRVTERRVPQIVVLYVILGWGVLQIMDQLVDRAVLPGLAYRLTLVSFLSGIPAALVAAWFHGRKGDQPMRRIEYWLFGGLGLIWLTICLVIYLGWLSR